MRGVAWVGEEVAAEAEISFVLLEPGQGRDAADTDRQAPVARRFPTR